MCYVSFFNVKNETQIKFRYYTQIILCKRNIENNRLRESSEILASCDIKKIYKQLFTFKIILISYSI